MNDMADISLMDPGRIDIYGLDRDGLFALRRAAQARYAHLQDQEMEEADSPECMQWLEELSALEDLLEEIDERMENESLK